VSHARKCCYRLVGAALDVPTTAWAHVRPISMR
jgi:hypothetical protein